MSEMIERVAVAIARVGALEVDASANAMARAAIEAMRVMTPEMLKAIPHGQVLLSAAAWITMIDAALGKVDA